MRAQGELPYAVINLEGVLWRPMMTPSAADRLLDQIKAKIIFVDVHAEAPRRRLRLAGVSTGA
jgi:calcineurin-like phosphoesterase